MEWLAVSSVLMMGLGWGMLHAFDPDHLAAVAGVSASDNSSKTNYFRYALRWSAGHGFAIAGIAFIVFFLEYSLPSWFSEYAEHSISIILIIAGLIALTGLWRAHTCGQHQLSSSLPQRSAVIIGLIHGTAGSAPLLALIPLMNIDHALVAMAYVLCFSVGVLLAMSFSGGLLSYSLSLSSRVSEQYQRLARLVLAIFSISVGIYLLF